MNSESARDPYVGLNRLIDERAEGTRLAWYAVGKLLSLSPLRIRADGMDLDSADLRVPESLIPNFMQGAAERGIRAALPEKAFEGTCRVVVEGEHVLGHGLRHAPAGAGAEQNAACRGRRGAASALGRRADLLSD